MNLNEKTIHELHDLLKSKEISALDITKDVIKRMGETEGLNTFITETKKAALKKAAYIDNEIISKGDFPKLTGIPFSIKDNFCTKGIKTTAGSKMLENYLPPFDATSITKLDEAILVGKTNLDEFAMGSSGENSAFGPTKNPYDLTRVTGGTSSGSAAALASGSSIFTVGTDTGGSVRQPAGFCGVVGLKPTYGRISRYGVIAMASSLDTISLFTKDVEDAAIVLKELAGNDVNDQTTPDVKVDDYEKFLKKDLKGIKLGVPKEYFTGEGVDKEVVRNIEKSISVLNGLGAEIVKVSLPHTDYAIAAYYLIMSSEVSSNMSRYDGIKYGFSDQSGKDLLSVYLDSRKKALGKEVKRRIMLGTFSLSHGYYDKYYAQAQKVRTLVKQDFEKVFDQVDALITPTSPTTAFKLGEKVNDPLAMYMADVFTVPASLAGVPAICVPSGQKNNLPIGMQIIGPQFSEGKIIQIAYAFEQKRGKIDLSLKV